jgi:hypothetical protein
MLANIEFHEIDSWNLVGGTSEICYYGSILIMRLYVTLGWLERLFETGKTAIPGFKDSFWV